MEIRGLKELQRAIKELGKAPGVTPAARKGMTIAYRSAKTKAPEDTGDLKKGIILKKREKSQGQSSLPGHDGLQHERHLRQSL